MDDLNSSIAHWNGMKVNYHARLFMLTSTAKHYGFTLVATCALCTQWYRAGQSANEQTINV